MPSEVGVEVRCPRWAIRQICYPEGIRLPKLKREYFNSYSPARTELNVWENRHLPARYQREQQEWRRKKFAQAKPGNLIATAYAYWSGQEEPRAQLAVCRFCGARTWSQEERFAHQQRELVGRAQVPHTKLLDMLAKILRAQEKCVVCAQKTKGARWGYPLCGEQKCLDDFMFRLNWSWAASWHDARAKVLKEVTGVEV